MLVYVGVFFFVYSRMSVRAEVGAGEEGGKACITSEMPFLTFLTT